MPVPAGRRVFGEQKAVAVRAQQQRRVLPVQHHVRGQRTVAVALSRARAVSLVRKRVRQRVARAGTAAASRVPLHPHEVAHRRADRIVERQLRHVRRHGGDRGGVERRAQQVNGQRVRHAAGRRRARAHRNHVDLQAVEAGQQRQLELLRVGRHRAGPLGDHHLVRRRVGALVPVPGDRARRVRKHDALEREQKLRDRELKGDARKERGRRQQRHRQRVHAAAARHLGLRRLLGRAQPQVGARERERSAAHRDGRNAERRARAAVGVHDARVAVRGEVRGAKQAQRIGRRHAQLDVGGDARAHREPARQRRAARAVRERDRQHVDDERVQSGRHRDGHPRVVRVDVREAAHGHAGRGRLVQHAARRETGAVRIRRGPLLAPVADASQQLGARRQLPRAAHLRLPHRLELDQLEVDHVLGAGRGVGVRELGARRVQCAAGSARVHAHIEAHGRLLVDHELHQVDVEARRRGVVVLVRLVRARVAVELGVGNAERQRVGADEVHEALLVARGVGPVGK